MDDDAEFERLLANDDGFAYAEDFSVAAPSGKKAMVGMSSGSGSMQQYAKRIDLRRKVQAVERKAEAEVKGKDKSDRATTEQVLDPRTRMIIFKMLNKGLFAEINGCISTGKEANVYHAKSEDDKHYAVKVFKTSILVFKDRDKYVSGEYRFRSGYAKSNPRKMVKVWAEKEMRNLVRLRDAGIRSPEPIALKMHVLVMGFIGRDGWPAPRLKDAKVSADRARLLYVQLVKIMRKMFHVCKLVHADLSEYNILYHKKKLYIIDVSQSVEHDHPRALDFLRMDCTNVTDFFKKLGLSPMTARQLFTFVTIPNLPDDRVDDYLDAIQTMNDSGGDLSTAQQIDDEVFMRAFIPRTLEEVVDYERDVDALGDGDTSNIFYQDIMGMGDLGLEPKEGGEVGGEEEEGGGKKGDGGDGGDAGGDGGTGGDAGGDGDGDDAGGDGDAGDNGDNEDEEYVGKMVLDPELQKTMSKKEWKKLVKEFNRERRQNKIPKKVKKRRKKLAKQGR